MASGRLTGGTVLCPSARHFIIGFVLAQPRKTENCPDMTCFHLHCYVKFS